MLVGNWTYSIPNTKEVDAFKVASQYFKKHGAVGSSIGSLLGKDNGLYTVNIGYENYTHFGEVDDKISSDEQWGKDMEPYFSESKWEAMNFYEPLIHNMESDAGVKPVFAQWMFFHQDMNMIQERGEVFIKAWMDAGATGGSVGRLIGKDDGSYGFAARFNTMKEYGAAQDKLNGEEFFSNHRDFLDAIDWRGFTLMRILETTWD